MKLSLFKPKEMEKQTFLTFYSVLNHSDIGKTFCNYLKKQNKEETWKFIVSSQLLEILVQKSNKTRATKQIKMILKTFFDEKNIKIQETDDFQNLFSNILEKIKTESLDQLYPLIIDLKNHLLPSYKNIEFKNFQNTKEAQDLCKTYESNQFMVTSSSMEYEFKDVDFEIMYLQIRDFEFFKKLENENPKDWMVIHSTLNAKLMRSFQHYLHHVKFLELPVVLRSESFYKANLQELSAGILHKFFENDSICVFFKVIDYQPNQFIVDQYVKRPPAEIRVRRLICTLKYENESIFGIMKPVKIPEMEFLKFQNMKFFRNGEEQIERGVQEFYYVGFRISKVNDEQCKLETVCILDGRFGISGIPESRANQKSMEFYKQFSSGLKKTKGKKIKDFKEQFNEMKHGLPSSPFSKMLYDLNLDQYESPREENQFVYNILGNIQFSPKNEVNELKENFLENISITPSEFKFIKKESPESIEKSILGNILISEGKKEVEQNILEGELLENISKIIENNSEHNRNIQNSDEKDLVFSDFVDDEFFREIYKFEDQKEQKFDFDELNVVFGE
jgi:hypothetical protein